MQAMFDALPKNTERVKDTRRYHKRKLYEKDKALREARREAEKTRHRDIP